MSVKLLFQDLPQYLDGDGVPYAGAQLFTYAAGSSTKQTTYQDSAGSTPHANPIDLDANGRVPAAIWGTVGQTFKLVLAPSDDTDPPASPIWTIDNVSPINDASVTLDQWSSSGLTATYISGTQFSVPGDQTTVLHVGRRVKVTDAGGTKYGYITASVFAALTTVTVVLDTGSLSSPISALDISIQTADNPSDALLTDAHPLRSGSSDKTKKVRLEVDGLTTATTRVLTAPDADITLGSFADSSDPTKKVAFGLSGITTGNTRTITMPDANVTLGLGAATGVAQTFLGADVNLNNTANYFDVVNTGSIGASGQKWLIRAAVCLTDTGASANFLVRIWDGSSTVYVESETTIAAANHFELAMVEAIVTLSAATTFHLSCKDPTNTTGVAKTTGGAGTANKATWITALRLV